MFEGPLVQSLQQLPPELATLILAMLPVTELRASIPIGIKVFDLSPFSAFVFSVIGTSIPAVIVLWLIEPISTWIQRHSQRLNKILQWFYKRVSKQLKGKETLGGVALALFVGVPLPGTGAWTGALAAFLLGLSFKQSFPPIFLGIIISGLIMTLVSTGIFASLDFLL